MRRNRRMTAVTAGLFLAVVTAGPVEAGGPVDRDGLPARETQDPSQRVALRDRSPGGEAVAPLAFPGATGYLAYSHSDAGYWPAWVSAVDPGGTYAADLTAAGIGIGDSYPAWSPGGTMIAFSRDMTTSTTDDADDIFVMDEDGGSVRRLTTTSADDYAPSWSPDASRIAFSSNRSGNYEIYTMNADGTAVTRRTTNAAGDYAPAWSPNGAKIAFQSTRSGSLDVFVMNADGSGVTQLTTDGASDAVPHWSPDGTQIAFQSTRTGDWDVYVMNADGSDVVNLSNNGSGNDFMPAWSPDGVHVAWSTDEFTDWDILVTAVGSGLVQPLVQTVDDEWNPDWQPIPAFPLVDAKFSPFKSDIEWVFNAGITTGCSAERYCPDGYVTREQMASFLARALKLTGTAPDAFTDDEASPHEPNINLVAKAGIATGCAATKYCPTALVSREQMASFLARALKLAGTAPDAFTDDEQSIHEPNINLVAKAGVATGCGAGKYCPTANVTRGQMAAFLHRAFGP